MFPGRSHPLIKRAIRTVRTGRVSVARGEALSLLVTYMVDAGSLLSSLFSLLLYPDGSVLEHPEFLHLSATPVDLTVEWSSMFEAWAPAAIKTAKQQAEKVARRISLAAEAAFQERRTKAAAATKAWIIRRADEICGPTVGVESDLFHDGPSRRDWRSCLSAEQRLAGCAADPSIPMAHRREAADALAHLTAVAPAFPQPTVRMLGMLMLVP